jgi:hypothetical protein
VSSSGAAVSLPTNPANLFEAYFKVFETYSGVKIPTAAAATERQDLWLSSFTQKGGDYENLMVQPLTNLDKLPYEANICLPSAPASARVLVLVEADGQLDEDQQFVQTTGYRSFDRAALQLLASHNFPEADAPQAYLAEVAVDYEPENCEWPPTVDQLPDEYFAVLENYIGPDLTTPAEAEAAQSAWLAEVKGAELVAFADPDAPAATLLEPLETEVEYPLAICLPIEPKDAQWGVVVNPDGTIAGNPQMLRSTGYRNFDERAQELMKAFEFPDADDPLAYVVEVPVDYNSVNCQQLDSESFAVPSYAHPTARTAPGSEPDSPAASTAAFDAAQQAELIAVGRANVEVDPVGGFNSDPGLLAAILEAGWPEAIDQSCFLAAIDAEAGPVPVAAAEDALVLSENFDFVPNTLSKLYGVEVADADDYCGAPLYEMTVNGTPQLFASAVGFGAGNANALVVIWPADPR